MVVCRKRKKNSFERSSIDRLIDDIITMVEVAYGNNKRAPKRLSPSLYWRIGKRLCNGLKDVESPNQTLDIVERLVNHLDNTVFTRATFLHTMSFVERFPEYEQINTLSRNLTWDHYRLLINIEDPTQRDFYAWMTYIKRWTSRDLKSHIQEDLYRKTPNARAKQQAEKHKELRDFESVLMRALLTRDDRILSFPESEEPKKLS